MPATVLTGTRIRERRTVLGVRQAELARRVGISASYLNLIEHNRRRIGGKVLVDLARALAVEPSALTEAADGALLAELRDAATGQGPEPAEIGHDEIDRAEDFARRFPGWAALTAAQARRVAALERTVSMLTDRLTHDPFLSASLHDILSTVTAIRAASGILVETPDIDREWRDRFHRNLAEDSERLAESAQALVQYLDDAGSSADTGLNSPQEELQAWLGVHGFHVAELERALPARPETLLPAAGGPLASAAARVLATGFLKRYRADALRMPLQPFLAALDEAGLDPTRLAERFGADLAAVLRRIAVLPEGQGPASVGLVISDASGTLTFRKPVEGFALPRFGAACPLWPLFQAMSQPMTPVRAAVALPGRDEARFLCFAVSQPARPPGFDAPPVFEATMLIVPLDAAPGADLPLRPVGTSCRICPRRDCRARREPSILAQSL